MEPVVLYKTLYDEQAIRLAAEEYAHLAAIDIIDADDRWEVRFADIDPDVADILHLEFANHALFHTISGRKSW